MVAISRETTPLLEQFVQDAAYANGAAEYGDGTFLEGLLEIIRELLPFIMDCFPAKKAKSVFVASVRDLNQLQVIRLNRQSRRLARRNGKLKGRKDKVLAANAAANGVVTALASTSDEELGAMFDEYHNN